MSRGWSMKGSFGERTPMQRTRVVVALTDAGLARLTETAPVHLRGVAETFVAPLDDQELAVLRSALDKVVVDCTFG